MIGLSFASHKMLVDSAGLKGNCVGDQHAGSGQRVSSPQHPQGSVITHRPSQKQVNSLVHRVLPSSILFFLTTEYRWAEPE
jgi:hypothetical protein